MRKLLDEFVNFARKKKIAARQLVEQQYIALPLK